MSLQTGLDQRIGKTRHMVRALVLPSAKAVQMALPTSLPFSSPPLASLLWWLLPSWGLEPRSSQAAEAAQQNISSSAAPDGSTLSI